MPKEFVSTHEKIFGHNYGDSFSRDRGENLSSWLALYFFSCAKRKSLHSFIGKVFVLTKTENPCATLCEYFFCHDTRKTLPKDMILFFLYARQKIFRQSYDRSISLINRETGTANFGDSYFSCLMGKSSFNAEDSVFLVRYEKSHPGDYLQFHNFVELNTTASAHYSVPVIPGGTQVMKAIGQKATLVKIRHFITLWSSFQ